ncbi:MAG: aldehyde dehydrogenase family protein [Candidatus Bathyarchaeia archaeon]
MVKQLKMYIDGEWVDAGSGETFEVKSPATGEALALVPKADREDVKKAIDAAKIAQKRISNMKISERVKLMYKMAEIIRPNIERFARELSLEQGKPIRESRIELEDVEPNITWQAEDLKRLETPILRGYANPDMLYLVTREPIGVVGIITPWNYPWLMPAEFVAQAILCGNSVVFKPASYTPISAIRFVECMEKAGVPKGVINLVTGPGPIVGAEIAENRNVDGILLVGETLTGENIAKAAGVKKITLELGGNGPLIVMDDANIEKAVDDIVFGCYNNAGQVCCANERILVHEKVHDKVVKMVVEKTKKMKLGDPLKDNTDIGPMNNEPVVKKVEMHIADAVNKGAKILYGGKRAKGFPTDLYFEPTVIDKVTPDMLINKEETFGPVAPFLTFSSIGEAVEIANDTPYGLSMAVHTNDLNTAFFFAEKLKAGQVVINGSVLLWDYHHPWAGVKRSGVGAVAGKWTIEAFTNIKTILLRVGKPGGVSK